MKAPYLFDRVNPAADPAFVPCDPRVPTDARPRLSRQTQAIVDRLRQGEASNAELAAISLKYGGRISDARKAGYQIVVVAQDFRSGYVRYRLAGE